MDDSGANSKCLRGDWRSRGGVLLGVVMGLRVRGRRGEGEGDGEKGEEG